MQRTPRTLTVTVTEATEPLDVTGFLAAYARALITEVSQAPETRAA